VGIQRVPNLLRWTGLACCLPYPGGPKSARDCFFLFGISLHPDGTGSATTLDFSRLQSSLRAYFALMLRPASWLALLSRTFTFELAPTRSPSIGVEYDYMGKQSIPTAGLSPASPTALWAADHRSSPVRPHQLGTKLWINLELVSRCSSRQSRRRRQGLSGSRATLVSLRPVLGPR